MLLFGGGAVTGQAGSNILICTSKAYSFFAGITSFHVCLSLNISALVFSSTCDKQNAKLNLIKRQIQIQVAELTETYRFEYTAKCGYDVLTEERQVRSTDVLDNAINQIKYGQFHFRAYLNTNKLILCSWALVSLLPIFFFSHTYLLSTHTKSM